MRTVIFGILALFTTSVLADDADTKSPESVVAALYATVSVQPGGQHDWPRFRALFAPEATLMVRTRDGGLRSMSVEKFIEQSTKNAAQGFVEHELAARWEKYGHIAHGWSSYEGVIGSGETKQVIRGVNSLQLLSINDRWLIANILWESDRSGGELPKDMRGASPVAHENE